MGALPSSQSVVQHWLPLGCEHDMLHPFFETNLNNPANIPAMHVMIAIIHAPSAVCISHTTT